MAGERSTSYSARLVRIHGNAAQAISVEYGHATLGVGLTRASLAPHGVDGLYERRRRQPQISRSREARRDGTR